MGLGGVGAIYQIPNNKCPNRRSGGSFCAFIPPVLTRRVDTAISALKYYAPEICQMYHQPPNHRHTPTL